MFLGIEVDCSDPFNCIEIDYDGKFIPYCSGNRLLAAVSSKDLIEKSKASALMIGHSLDI
jgi:hypothetical protein